MLRIRDVYPGYKFFSSRFLDPGSKTFPDPLSALKNLSILTQKIVSKLSEYDRGCSCRIRILIFLPSRIPDPGIKMAPNPGSRIRNTAGQLTPPICSVLFFVIFWWQDATLFDYFSYFYNIHTVIQSHSYNTIIRRHSLRPLSISSSLDSSVG